MKQVTNSLQIEFNDNNILSSLFGVSDQNIHLLEKMNNVRIEYRGNIVKIIGKKRILRIGYGMKNYMRFYYLKF